MKPERLERTTVDGSKLNLEALYRIAPSCFTECEDRKVESGVISVDKNGQHVRMAVNFTTLRQLLGDAAVEDGEEMYQFTWPGKQAARREAAAPITDTLRPVPEDSVDWDTTQNLYIEGDNLRVLKLLQKGYMGKVKMIYIDPPYNTGNDFVYHDDFAHSLEEEELAVGNVDEEGNRYRKNLDSNGRFHSDWCSMIYSRMLVARSLLTEDGVIFISIGVEELATLKNICNEIFGEQNFIEIFSWVKTSTPLSLATKSRKTNEYILCYEKNKNDIKYNGVPLDGGDAPLLNTGNPQTVLSFPKSSVYFKPSKFPNGHYEAFSSDRVDLLDDIEIIDGYSATDFRLRGEFKWGQDFLNNEIDNGTTFIIKSQELSIRFVRSGEGFKRPANFVKDEIITPLINKPNNNVGTNENASSYLRSLMDDSDVFSYPKPVSLIKYLINFIVRSGDIVMDFFSGSGTTAEAVFEQGLNESIKHLKFILVQLDEDLDQTLELVDANSKDIIKNGIKFLDKYHRPHLITELGKERIRRAGKKIKEESPMIAKDLDIGFRVFRLADSNYENVEKSPNEYDQQMLDLFADNIKTDRTDLDLLFGAMLSWGVQLSLPMKTEEVDGCKIYTVDGNGLVACFAENVTENVVMAMADKQPLRVLFRDSCFGADKAKINIFELFKQQLDWDESESMQNIRVI